MMVKDFFKTPMHKTVTKTRNNDDVKKYYCRLKTLISSIADNVYQSQYELNNKIIDNTWLKVGLINYRQRLLLPWIGKANYFSWVMVEGD